MAEGLKKITVVGGKYRTRAAINPETGKRIKKLMVFRSGESFYSYEEIPKAFRNMLKSEEERDNRLIENPGVSVDEEPGTGEDTDEEENAAENVVRTAVFDENGDSIDVTEIGGALPENLPEYDLSENLSEVPAEVATVDEVPVEVVPEAKPFRRTKKV